jgi:hypothetical protein
MDTNLRERLRQRAGHLSLPLLSRLSSIRTLCIGEASYCHHLFRQSCLETGGTHGKLRHYQCGDVNMLHWPVAASQSPEISDDDSPINASADTARHSSRASGTASVDEEKEELYIRLRGMAPFTCAELPPAGWFSSNVLRRRFGRTSPARVQQPQVIFVSPNLPAAWASLRELYVPEVTAPFAEWLQRAQERALFLWQGDTSSHRSRRGGRLHHPAVYDAIPIVMNVNNASSESESASASIHGSGNVLEDIVWITGWNEALEGIFHRGYELGKEDGYENGRNDERRLSDRRKRKEIEVEKDKERDKVNGDPSMSGTSTSQPPMHTHNDSDSHSHRKRREVEDIESIVTCPITGEVLKDPVISPASGRSFERSAILQWLSMQSNDPLSRSALHPSDLVPNRTLKELIGRLKYFGIIS